MPSIYMKHAITGKIAAYPAHYRNHPVLGKHLEEVEDPNEGCVDCGVPGDLDETLPEDVAASEEVVETQHAYGDGNYGHYYDYPTTEEV